MTTHPRQSPSTVSTLHYFIPLEIAPEYNLSSNDYIKYHIPESPDQTIGARQGVSGCFVLHNVLVEGLDFQPLKAAAKLAESRVSEPREPEAPSELVCELKVVEVIITRSPESAEAQDDYAGDFSDSMYSPLPEAIEALNKFLNTFSIFSNIPIPSVSLEKLRPSIPVACGTAAKGELEDLRSLPTLTSYSHLLIILGNRAERKSREDVYKLDARQTAEYFDRQYRQFAVYGLFSEVAELRKDAVLELRNHGNTRASAILTCCATEVFIRDLLFLQLWEANVRPEDACKRLRSKKGAPRGVVDLVKSQLLCGAPDKSAEDGFPEPIQKWMNHTVQLRNKAVHQGYQPSLNEAQASLEGLEELQRYFEDDLFKKAELYPITARAVLTQAAPGGTRLLKLQLIEDLYLDSYTEEVLKRFQRWRTAVEIIQEREYYKRQPQPLTTYCFLSHQNHAEPRYLAIDTTGVFASELKEPELIFPDESLAEKSEIEVSPPDPLVLESSEGVPCLPIGAMPTRRELPWDLYAYDHLPDYACHCRREYDARS